MGNLLSFFFTVGCQNHHGAIYEHIPQHVKSMQTLFQTLFIQYGVVIGFMALVLAPLGLPIPEEVSLLAMGVLLGNGHATLLTTWIYAFLGVTLGDLIAWYFGRKMGLESTGFVSRLIGEQQIQDIEQFYRKYGDWAIVIARQIPGMRFPTFFFAGASAVSMGRFYLIDGLSALVTVNLYLGLGYYFADDAKRIKENTESFIEYAGYLSGLLLIMLGLRFAYRRWKGSREG